MINRLLFLPLVLLSLVIAGSSACRAEDSRAFELRIYTAAPGKLDDLLARFRDHTCRIFETHQIENIGYWVPLDAESGGGNTLYYLIAHKSREAAKENWAAFGKDPAWQEARKNSEAGGKLLTKIESIFLKATDYSPAIKIGAGEKDRVFELRIYQTPEGRLDALHNRFRDHTIALFTRHGMTHVGYWTPTDPDKGAANKLIYILAHPGKDAGLAAFQAFREDPAWIKAKTESEKDGSLTLPAPNGVKSIYLKATDFSPLK